MGRRFAAILAADVVCYCCTLTAIFGLLAACSTLPRLAPEEEGVVAGERYLFRAETVIQDEWLHMPLQGATDYSMAIMEGQLAIRAIGTKEVGSSITA